MTTALGTTVREARKARGWGMDDLAALLDEMGIPGLTPGVLSRYEKGEREPEPAFWGKAWQALRLPLRDLYEGLGLPVPEELPSGIAGEVYELTRRMSPEAQRILLGQARHLPGIVDAALAERQDPIAPVLKRVAESGLEYGESVGSEYGSAPRSRELLDTSWQKPKPTRKARS